MSDTGRKDHRILADHDAMSAVQLSEALTAAIDAWANAHQTNRSDAIGRLVELGLKATSGKAQDPSARHDWLGIEDEAIHQIHRPLDPSLPPDERERRIRRLVDGPPEFSGHRTDLPKHRK